MPCPRQSARPLPVVLRRLCAVVVCAVALTTGIPTAATAENPNGTSIVYSDAFARLIAAFPSGYADSCDISVVLNGGGGICDALIDLVYFYPDATLGPRPWYVDSSSPTGWSIAPDPCDGLSGEEYELWATHVDYVNGYLASGPDLTAEQVDRYGACWGWWF